MNNHLTQIIMEAFPTSGNPHVACPCCILNEVFSLILLSVFFSLMSLSFSALFWILLILLPLCWQRSLLKTDLKRLLHIISPMSFLLKPCPFPFPSTLTSDFSFRFLFLFWMISFLPVDVVSRLRMVFFCLFETPTYIILSCFTFDTDLCFIADI